MKRIDLTGKRFGKLTAIKYVGNDRWLCKCDCGNETEVLSMNLRSAHTKSCGCLKGTGIIGRRVGQLVVIEKINNIQYLCKCDCGNVAIRNYISLVDKLTSSCDECSNKKRAEAVKSKVFVDGTMPCLIKLDKKPTKANKSGIVGVNWDKSRNKWQASIKLRGHRYNLGRFDDIEDAIAVRKEAEKLYFGSFIEWYEEYKKRKGTT